MTFLVAPFQLDPISQLRLVGFSVVNRPGTMITNGQRISATS